MISPEAITVSTSSTIIAGVISNSARPFCCMRLVNLKSQIVTSILRCQIGTSRLNSHHTIHYSVRIKRPFQILVQRSKLGGQGMERRAILFRMTEQRGMTASFLRLHADIRGGRIAFEPALRAAPVDEPFSRQIDRQCGGRDGQAPERHVVLEEAVPVFPYLAPEIVTFIHRLATQLGARGLHAQLGPGESHI